MPEFRVGDKVRIKSLEEIRKVFNDGEGEFTPNTFNNMYFGENYKQYCGLKAVIVRINDNNTYNYGLKLLNNVLGYNKREFEILKSLISFKPLY